MRIFSKFLVHYDIMRLLNWPIASTLLFKANLRIWEFGRLVLYISVFMLCSADRSSGFSCWDLCPRLFLRCSSKRTRGNFHLVLCCLISKNCPTDRTSGYPCRDLCSRMRLLCSLERILTHVFLNSIVIMLGQTYFGI